MYVFVAFQRVSRKIGSPIELPSLNKDFTYLLTYLWSCKVWFGTACAMLCFSMAWDVMAWYGVVCQGTVPSCMVCFSGPGP